MDKNKGLSTKQKEQVKKWLIFSGLGLIFAFSMWFIFKPSERELAMEQSGLNDMVPQASVDQLEENKLKAYELSSYEESVEEQRKEIGRLSDYFVQEDTSPYPLKGQREDSASTSEAWGGDIAGRFSSMKK